MVIRVERIPKSGDVEMISITSKDKSFRVEQEISPKVERHMQDQSVMYFYAIFREGILHIGTPARISDF